MCVFLENNLIPVGRMACFYKANENVRVVKGLNGPFVVFAEVE
jgi:hypothetical protein